MAKVTVNAAAIDAQCSSLLGADFKAYAGSAMMQLMEQYVPFRGGDLRGDAVPGPLSVTYGGSAEPYARYQYHLKTANRTTAGTDGKWDEAAFPKHDADLSRALTQYIRSH